MRDLRTHTQTDRQNLHVAQYVHVCSLIWSFLHFWIFIASVLWSIRYSVHIGNKKLVIAKFIKKLL